MLINIKAFLYIIALVVLKEFILTHHNKIEFIDAEFKLKWNEITSLTQPQLSQEWDKCKEPILFYDFWKETQKSRGLGDPSNFFFFLTAINLKFSKNNTIYQETLPCTCTCYSKS